MEEELTVPSPDGCVLGIPNTVVMEKDRFLSFVFFRDSLFHVTKYSLQLQLILLRVFFLLFVGYIKIELPYIYKNIFSYSIGVCCRR